MFDLMSKTTVFLLYFILACLCSASSANNAKINISEKEKQVLDQLLGHGKYDARIRPSGLIGTDGPAEIRVNMFVRRISKVDDVNMEYKVEMTFREQWIDERLKFDDIGGELKFLSLTETNRIWMPDLFFSNEKYSHSHNTFVPNFYIRIFPNGSILYSIRITLTLACSMNFKLFPFDLQYCPLQLVSYGSTGRDVMPLWKDGNAVQVSKNSELRGFTLKNFTSDSCGAPDFGCLKVNFIFERASLHYLIHVYIPCCILVLASFVSFWLDQEAVAARVSLGIASLLTMVMVIIISNVNGSLPPVSYIKAIDIWNIVCLMFIFATLLEFATINYTSRLDMQNKLGTADRGVISNSNDEMTMGQKTWTAHYKYCCAWLSEFSRSNKFDIISRIVFPLAFALFNLAYWNKYLGSNDDQ